MTTEESTQGALLSEHVIVGDRMKPKEAYYHLEQLKS